MLKAALDPSAKNKMQTTHALQDLQRFRVRIISRKAACSMDAFDDLEYRRLNIDVLMQ